MGLRDKLAERARPYLEPGEQIQAVFRAGSYRWRVWVWAILVSVYPTVALVVVLVVFVHPWSAELQQHLLQILFGSANVVHVLRAVFSPVSVVVVATLVSLLYVRVHDIVVTDRAIVVLDISKWTHRPTRLRVRHPRDFHFGQLSWRKQSFVLDNTKYWVGRKFYKDVATADAVLTQITQYRQ